MPMVPTFQNNIPSVRDNGGSGMVPAQQVRSNFNYPEVMKEALKPINEAAQTVQEVLKINHARTVKAESDDAEQQVIQTINTYMNDPDNGYMTKQGRNAMDGFEPTIQGMQKDINKIVGSLQPATRQAVESRINDRLNSAVNQATRWNTQQTQKYHFDSSKARVETLLDDGANHYADRNYLAKTWASIEAELQYQTQEYAGMPPEAAKQMREQTYGLFQAKRFDAWAQDNPVMAYAVFRDERGNIDPDIAQKIENSLFAQSRDLLAYELANRPIQYDEDGKLVNAKWMDDPRAKTGNDFIDSLSPNQHLSVVTKAMQLRHAMTTELKNAMTVETANSLARVLTTGTDNNPLTLGQFVEVYGSKDGQKNYDQYRMDFDYNQTLYDLKGMSNSAITDMLKAEKPSPQSDNYAQELKYWENKRKAAAQIVKDRTADPVGYALENGLYGYEPLNFENSSQIKEQLEYRARNSGTLRDNWGTTKNVLSKAEATQLAGVLDKSDIDAKLSTLKTIAHATGAEGVRSVAEQLKGGNTMYAMAMAGIEDYGQDGSISVGEMYLRGKDAIEQKRVKIDNTAMYGLDASIYNALGDEDDVKGVFTNPQVLNSTAELVRGVYGYMALNGGSAQEAIEEAVGTIYHHNGKKIVLPSNVSGVALMGDDFDDLVLKKANDIKKEKKNFYAGGFSITPEEFSQMLPSMKLQTYQRLGNRMAYQVLYNGEVVRNSDGEVYLLEIGGDEE